MAPATEAPRRVPTHAGGSSPASFYADGRDEGRRLDVAVAERLPQISRSRITRLAHEGRILVDGTARKPAFRIRPGQRVEVRVPAPEPSTLRPEPIPLDVVYEDDDLLVVNKPAGLTVHPSPGHASGTLVNAVLSHVPSLPGIAGTLRPGIVHRLDKDTSGLIAVAKSEEAQVSLASQLRSHTVVRTYLAIVRGSLRRDTGKISAPVGRHPVRRTRIAVTPRGRAAVTHYTVLERFPGATLVACRLETGRTHQIRVHMTHIGHPLLGDPVYGHAPTPEMRRQALHAARLEFTHPRTGRRLVCTAPVPEDFARLLARLRGSGAGRDAARPDRPEGRRDGR